MATSVDQALIRRYVVPYVVPKAEDGKPNRAAIDAATPELGKVLTMLEARLSSRDYLAANHFTFADALPITALNPVFRFPEAAEILGASPATRRYFEPHSQRPSFVKTAANP